MKLGKKLLLTSLGLVPLGLASLSVFSLVMLTTSSDGTKKEEGEQSQTKDLNLSSSLKVSGSIAELLPTDESILVDYATIIENKIKESETLKKSLITNYSSLSDEQASKLNFDVTIASIEKGSWGGTVEYSSWSVVEGSKIKNIFYSSKSSQFNITSLADLKAKLNPQTLKQIMVDAGYINSNSTNTFVLNKESKIAIDDSNDYLHINVVETTPSTVALAVDGYNGTTYTSKTNQLDLCLPVSDINVIFKDAKISVTTEDTSVNDKTNQEIEFVYNVGIDSSFDANVIPKQIYFDDTNMTTFDVKDVIQKLNWGQVNDQTVALNYETIGQSIKVFNTTFSDVSLMETPTEENPNNYSLSLVSTPNDGYSWVDGTSEARTLTFKNIDISIKTAIYKTEGIEYQLDILLSAEPSVENLTAYLNTNEGKEALKKVERTLLNNQDNFKHVTFTYDSTTPIAQVSGTTNKMFKVTFIVAPENKFSFKNNDNKSIKVVVTFTGVKKQSTI